MLHFTKKNFFLARVSHPTEGVTQFSWFVDHDLKSSILNTDYKLVQTRHQAIYFTTNVNWGKYCFFFLWLTLERGRLTEKSTDNEDINWLVDNLRIQWKSHLFFFFYRTVEHQKASLWGGGGELEHALFVPKKGLRSAVIRSVATGAPLPEYLTINEWGWVSYEELLSSRRLLSASAYGLDG